VTAVLQRPTLVLNRCWQPVGVVPVARTLSLVCAGTARIVDHDYQLYSWADWASLIPADDEPFIQGVGFRLRVPEVISLTRYDRQHRGSVPFSRRNLYRRDRFTCQYCGSRPGTTELTIDHVVPRSHGGLSTWVNCVLACVQCNRRKANRTPTQARMNLATTPIRPAWHPQYAWPKTSPKSWKQFLSDAYWNVELEE
jgi:5-methylcytosine-specific restriction endonuclease McrA